MCVEHAAVCCLTESTLIFILSEEEKARKCGRKARTAFCLDLADLSGVCKTLRS